MRLISIINANALCDTTHIDSYALSGGGLCFTDRKTNFSISYMTVPNGNSVPTSHACLRAIQMVGSGQVMDAIEADAKIPAFFPMLPLMALARAANTHRAGRVALSAGSSSMGSRSNRRRRSKHG